MIWLSSDHTGGPTYPEAGGSDNDLPRVTSSTRSRTASTGRTPRFFVVEDDSQDGADHVDGPPCPGPDHQPVVAARRGRQHLLLADQHGPNHRADPRRPAAEREARCGDADVRRVHKRPNYSPFNAVPNQIPLTEGIATPPACGLDTLGTSGAARTALARSEARNNAVPADEKATAAAWQTWLAGQHLTATVRSLTTPTRSR